MIDQSTPGMGHLARKFLQEGRSFEEFAEAQDVWREEFRMCGKYDDWPLDEDGFIARLSLIFGDHEPVEPVERGEGGCGLSEPGDCRCLEQEGCQLSWESPGEME